MAEPERAPVAWWKQVLGYTGVCVVEALFAAVLIYAYFAVAFPYIIGGGGDMARVCGLCAMIFLGPALWLAALVTFVIAKVAVVLIPHARRHWALAVYWGVTLAFYGSELLRQQVSQGHTMDARVLLGGLGMVAIPALVLTLSHFFLLPRVAPGGTALDALRALVRYDASARK